MRESRLCICVLAHLHDLRFIKFFIQAWDRSTRRVRESKTKPIPSVTRIKSPPFSCLSGETSSGLVQVTAGRAPNYCLMRLFLSRIRKCQKIHGNRWILHIISKDKSTFITKQTLTKSTRAVMWVSSPTKSRFGTHP